MLSMAEWEAESLHIPIQFTGRGYFIESLALKAGVYAPTAYDL